MIDTVSERFHGAVNVYTQYYNMKPSRIGLIPMACIYFFQRYRVRKISRQLNN